MKKTSLFLLPPALATLVVARAAPPSVVYILTPDNPALAAMSSALNTLGYTQASPQTASGAESSGTYAALEPGTAYKNISRANPEARFILPAQQTGAGHDRSGETKVREQWPGEHDVDSIRAFFAEMGESSTSRLLELDVFAPRSHEQAQTWVALCDFLGLGYSVVERLKLWHFPK
ncbi:hypothetical protein F4861DRAFT_537825 [Xylaria intraflava]|nr:hypothetical protein F4861DRAFT_537825 [Xylaria intraflava]